MYKWQALLHYAHQWRKVNLKQTFVIIFWNKGKALKSSEWAFLTPWKDVSLSVKPGFNLMFGTPFIVNFYNIGLVYLIRAWLWSQSAFVAPELGETTLRRDPLEHANVWQTLPDVRDSIRENTFSHIPSRSSLGPLQKDCFSLCGKELTEKDKKNSNWIFLSWFDFVYVITP